MDEKILRNTLEKAAAERGCILAGLKLDDDNNIEVLIDREEGEVDLADCTYVHRAVLAAFDRDVEDYALTVSSVGISAEEADTLLSKKGSDKK